MWLPAFLRSAYPQEFLCLAQDACDGLWRFELNDEDISGRHLFLGYRPLVIAVGGDHPSGDLFLRSTLHPRPVASIRLERIALPGMGPGITFFTGERARTHFLPWTQWPLDRIRRWRNARLQGNVATVPAEIDMTRIMYARPREIHLAVVGPPEQCNIFPTDLHGAVSDHYLISLRHAGKACAQVEHAGTVVLYRLSLDRSQTTYALASRHMAPMAPAERITAIDGAWNGYSRPAGALGVRQVKIEAHADSGIHRIFKCRIEQEDVFGKGTILAHMHAAPAAWLMRHGRSLEVRLR